MLGVVRDTASQLAAEQEESGTVEGSAMEKNTIKLNSQIRTLYGDVKWTGKSPLQHKGLCTFYTHIALSPINLYYHQAKFPEKGKTSRKLWKIYQEKKESSWYIKMEKCV